jgi:hypothetical protein
MLLIAKYRIQKWSPGASTGTTVAGGNGMSSKYNQLSYQTILRLTRQKTYILLTV